MLQSFERVYQKSVYTHGCYKTSWFLLKHDGKPRVVSTKSVASLRLHVSLKLPSKTYNTSMESVYNSSIKFRVANNLDHYAGNVSTTDVVMLDHL